MAMNSLPRWLISMTDMPVPCQSRSSSAARASTSAGSIAGPALKLKMRDIRKGPASVERSVDGGRRLGLGRQVVRRLVAGRLARLGLRGRRFGVPAVAAVGAMAAAVGAVAPLRAVAAVRAVAVQLALLDALQARELLAFAERDERDALRRAAHLPDLRHPGEDEHPAGRDEHDFVGFVHQHRAHDAAVALRSLDADHALAAAP